MGNGSRQGPAVDVLKDGTKAEGSYLDGKLHGRWLYTKPDGSQYECQYDHDKFVSRKVNSFYILVHPKKSIPPLIYPILGNTYPTLSLNGGVTVSCLFTGENYCKKNLQFDEEEKI